MSTERYNGWTNYATWRVNLEHFDGVMFVRDDVWGDSVSDFADQLESDVEVRLRNEFDSDNDANESIVLSYAEAFISGVNWYEIAAMHNESNELGLKS